MCGKYNTKNSFGGYVGYKSFIVHFASNNPNHIDDARYDPQFEVWVERSCNEIYGPH